MNAEVVRISHRNSTQSAVAARGSRMANNEVKYDERCCNAIFINRYAQAIQTHIYHIISHVPQLISHN